MNWLRAIVVIVAWLSFDAKAEERDLFQEAVNYVFTGTINPDDGVEIVNRPQCIVVLRDPEENRYVKYYLLRFNIGESRFNQIYDGRQALNNLEVQGDEILIEYLNMDKATVIKGYKSAQIQLPGNLDQTKKAISIIFSDFCRSDPSKEPF